MATRAAAARSLASHLMSQESVSHPRDLLSALFKSSTVGVAICDRQLRFCAINDALASMNGVPAAAHLGKTIHAVLGSAALKIQPAFEQVFATGEPLSNFELTAELPSREAVGHWNESYFPIRDNAGQVQQVAAIVLELAKYNELDAALFNLTNKLARITSALHCDSATIGRSRPSKLGGKASDGVSRSVGLMESCLAEARGLLQLLRSAPALAAVSPLRVSPGSQLERARGKQLAVAHPIEDEPTYPDLLTSREREVASLLAVGQSNKEIGTRLVISTRTVESHRARIMLKLDAHSLSELVRYAVRTHLIQP
jgi:DNA-binding CsgD family transcriptional regulator